MTNKERTGAFVLLAVLAAILCAWAVLAMPDRAGATSPSTAPSASTSKSASASKSASTSASSAPSASKSASVSASTSKSAAPSSSAAVYYDTCATAAAAGVTNIPTGAPGYRPGLDSDGDGTACEATTEASGPALPVTGVKLPVLLGAGAGMVALGVGGVLLARRRRVRWGA